MPAPREEHSANIGEHTHYRPRYATITYVLCHLSWRFLCLSSAFLHFHACASISQVQLASNIIIKKPLYSLLSSSIAPLSSITKLRLSRWLSSFISAWASLWLLQTRQTPSNLQENSETVNGDKPNKSRLAGRTIDLTLFTVVRAMDVIVSKVWTHYQANRKAGKTWTKACNQLLRE